MSVNLTECVRQLKLFINTLYSFQGDDKLTMIQVSQLVSVVFTVMFHFSVTACAFAKRVMYKDIIMMVPSNCKSSFYDGLLKLNFIIVHLFLRNVSISVSS